MTAALPFPPSGTTLLLGPSGVGKTRTTARALDAWVAERGTDGVVVLEFAPEFERDGEVLGGRLTRFGPVPDGVFYGVLEAHAPRAAAGGDEARAVELAADNARRAAALLARAPADPTATFVNDATIPFQHPSGDPERLTDYCEGADLAVLNAFESGELGTDDPVSRRERAALEHLESWADRTLRLGD